MTLSKTYEAALQVSAPRPAASVRHLSSSRESRRNERKASTTQIQMVFSIVQPFSKSNNRYCAVKRLCSWTPPSGVEGGCEGWAPAALAALHERCRSPGVQTAKARGTMHFSMLKCTKQHYDWRLVDTKKNSSLFVFGVAVHRYARRSLPAARHLAALNVAGQTASWACSFNN